MTKTVHQVCRNCLQRVSKMVSKILISFSIIFSEFEWIDLGLLLKILHPVRQNCFLWVQKNSLGFFLERLSMNVLAFDRKISRLSMTAFQLSCQICILRVWWNFLRKQKFEKVFDCLIVFESWARNLRTFCKKSSSGLWKLQSFSPLEYLVFWIHIFSKLFSETDEFFFEKIRKKNLAPLPQNWTLRGNRFFFRQK